MNGYRFGGLILYMHTNACTPTYIRVHYIIELQVTNRVDFPGRKCSDLLKVEIIVQILVNRRSDLNTISVLSQH